MSNTRVVLLSVAASILSATLVLGVGRMGAASGAPKASARAATNDAPASRGRALPPRADGVPRPLPAPPAPGGTAPETEPEPEATAPQRVDPDESNARAEARFEAAVRDFESAPEDSDWAPRASAALEADFGELSRSVGFSVESLACKSKRCVARVHWDDMADALRDHQQIAEARYSVRCMVEVMGKAGDSGKDGISMSVLFSECW